MWRKGTLSQITPSTNQEFNHETLRREPIRGDRLPLQLLPGARLLRLRDARAIRGGHQARLRGEGAERDRRRRPRRGPRLPESLRAPAGPRAEPLLGEPVRDDDV